MKVSIITVALNSAEFIEDCLKSIVSQDYKNIEYIVIDGGSTDGTIGILKRYEARIAKWISEPDRGIYDAMNKGLRMASGDVVGILNSDDFYIDENVIGCVVNCLSKKEVYTCYGDLVYIDADDSDRQVRYWKSGDFNKKKFRRGWMPPHPAFFVRHHIYEKYGLFNLDFPLAADYELMLRLLCKYNVTTEYIPKCLVKMRTGGSCRPGLTNTVRNIVENYHAWKVNGLKTNPLTFLMKPLSKTLQYIKQS